jgi:ABC-type multidrug transport system fused ATPase/permease subunit
MLIYTLKSPDLLNQVVLVSMILVQLNRPFEMIASAIQEYAMAQVLAEMLQSELDQHKAAKPASGGAAMPARPTFAIELAGLSFAHTPEDRPLFEGVSTHFGPHGLNFIVGPSGVGKTSLLQILLGINEAYSGVVRVGGVDLRAVDKDAYLAHVGYVAQEPMLMNLSIRDNVLFGRDYPDADVIAALRTVQLGDKLDSLAEGLDYKIGERGQLLSGGERQRLAIARALIGRPKVLMLDEASSALDEATERSIYASLRETAEDTTIIAVTHRLGVIGKGDRVLNLAAPASQLGERLLA